MANLTFRPVRAIVGLSLVFTTVLPMGSGYAAPTTAPKLTLAERRETFSSNILSFIEKSTDSQSNDDYVAHEYQRFFSQYQNQKAIRHLSRTDLKSLFKATITVVMHNPQSGLYQSDMARVFGELERRRIAGPWADQWRYELLIESRRFQEAHRFALKHPKAKLQPLPKITQNGPLPKGAPTELMIKTGKREIVRRPVDIKRGTRIVVVVSPFCHFARHGLSAVNADPVLRNVFMKHAIWLAPDTPPLAFNAYQRWDLQHPKEQIEITYSDREWSMISDWGTPTFYFFKNGKLVTELIGWFSKPDPKYPKGGSISSIKTALKKIGLLQSSE